jgi:uncharacterized protein YhaN
MSLRIERLDFRPWGCFEELSLDFEGPGRVDLVYGQNATGKSTTSRGQRSLLYGIDERTADGHSHDYADLRIGARLLLDGSGVELWRRKRRVGSLLDADGEPLATDPIAVALGGLSAGVYRDLFQVDHETLVKGGMELLEGGGEIGASLFAAAAGIASLNGILAALDREAEQIYSKRASSRVLNKALRELRACEKEIRESTLRPRRHAELCRVLERTEEGAAALGEEIRELELRGRVLERQRATAPLLIRHQELSSELEALAGTPHLTQDAAAERAKAEGQIQAGDLQLQRSRRSIEKLEGEIGAITIEEAVLGRREEIDALKEEIAAVRNWSRDLRKREGERAAAQAGLATAAAAVGVEAPELASLRRPEAALRSLDGWLQEHGALSNRRSVATKQLGDAEAALEDSQEALGQIAEAPELGGLEAAFDSALQAGPLEEQIADLRSQIETQSAERSSMLARLLPQVDSIEQLRELAAPSLEEARCALGEEEEARRGKEELAELAERLAGAEAELQEDRDRLLGEGAPPGAGALAEARARRDQSWAAIHRSAAAGAVLDLEEAQTFQAALAEADQVADLSISGATRIERSAALEAATRKLGRERSLLGEREKGLLAGADAREQAWIARWGKSGLEEAGPLTAAAWLERRDGILSLDRDLGAAEARLEVLLERECSHLESLGGALASTVGESEGLGLSDLLSAVRLALERGRELVEGRVVGEAALVGAERTLASARRELGLAKAACSEWEGLWAGRCEEAGLPAGSTPLAAQETVRAIGEGLGQLERVAELERRTAGIEADREEFEAKIRALCADLDPSLAELDPERVADVLHERLQGQVELESRRLSLIEQRSEAGKELELTEEALEGARARLAAMVAAGGCERAEELPALERRADRARALGAELAELEARVAEVGEGSFAEFTATGSGFDRDAAALEVEEIAREVEERQGRRDQLSEQIGEEKAALATAEESTDALRAAQEAEMVRAHVASAAAAYAEARIGAAIVRRAVERYRSLHQAPMLKRAGELFTRFTLGIFTELFVDADDGGEVVLYGREHGGLRKQVEQMSKGTREQLFLALRIAAIERYVQSTGPVPVVFDDVFIESDEPRSERIFEALGELAGKTQVIVLTHHRHLIEVGRRAIGEALAVQELPQSAPGSSAADFAAGDLEDAGEAASVGVSG